MCLAIPAKVIAIEGNQATVEMEEITTKTDISLVDNVNLGDYLIIHTGYAIEVLNPQEAAESLKIIRELAAFQAQEEK